MSEAVRLPTFCHVSQYGETAGYESLHQMLAISKPLYLWAPSSVHLSAAPSPISAVSFCKYLEEGHLRIIGRGEWLTEPSARAAHPWPGADWTPQIDGPIKAILENDASLPLEERRVIAAPEEAGDSWAADYVKEHAADLPAWMRLETKRSRAVARKHVPLGTYEAALRAREKHGDGQMAVQTILRDAHNHGQAIVDTGADFSIHLSHADNRFMRILGELPLAAAQARGASRTETRRLRHQLLDLGELSRQMVEELGRLEPKRSDLSDFIGGEGHELLVAWFSAITEQIKRTSPEAVDSEVGLILREELSQRVGYSLPAALARLPREGLDATATMTDFSTALISLALRQDTLGIVGAAASVFEVGRGLARTLGLMPGNYHGPQWPFLYVYGKKATERRRRELLKRLTMAGHEVGQTTEVE